MPSKLQLDVNLWFLYVCLQKSDYKTIDFNAVGQAANINPPAARMRFTRLKKAIESGALNCPTGTILAGNTEGIIGSPLHGGYTKNKGQANKLKRAKVPAKFKSDNKATDSTSMTENPYLTSNAIEQPVKMEIDEDGDCMMKDGDKVDGAHDRSDDEDDIPLALIRSFALAKKRYVESESFAQGIKRARVDLVHHPTRVPNINTGSSCFPTNGTNEDDVEIIGVRYSCVEPREEHQAQGGTTNAPMGPVVDPMFNPLQPQAWQSNQQQSIQTLPTYYGSTDAQSQTMGTLLNEIPVYAAASPQPAPAAAGPMSNITVSPSDTISISSASPVSSPSLKPAAPKSLLLPQLDTLCTRYPGLQETTNESRSWRNYRLPHIVITDMEPDAPRNWLHPHSPVAIGKAERAVNEALFGPYSVAFRQKPVSVGIAGGKVGVEVKDASRYLEVPRVKMEENPPVQNKARVFERQILPN